MFTAPSQPPIASVSDINRYLQLILEEDPNLSDIWIHGELTNVKHYDRGGILYFTLTDGEAQINCVMFSSFVSALKFNPQNGQSVVARGKLKVFHKKGTYSIQVAYMTPEGEGTLSKQFEALKKQLLDEGLFDPNRKKTIPTYVERVAVITGLRSAAMWDFINLTHQHAPHMHLTIIPAVMQGPLSSSSIQQAITLAESQAFDVVAIVRGGGAAEDLAWFNDEHVVRRLAACTHPTITAIGHDVDYTLSDFVSDFRAATPSAAVQKLADPFKTLLASLREKHVALRRALQRDLDDAYRAVEDSLDQGTLLLQDHFQTLSDRYTTLMQSAERANPLRKLKQGFSILSASSEKVVTSIREVNLGENITVSVSDGLIKATVLEITEKHHGDT